MGVVFVYYEEIKREIQRILIYECRRNERLKGKVEGFTRLGYTGLKGGLEHLKIDGCRCNDRLNKYEIRQKLFYFQENKKRREPRETMSHYKDIRTKHSASDVFLNVRLT